MSDVVKNLEEIRARIERAAKGVGRDPAEVTLVAVSKRKSTDLIREAYALGQRDFGENYAQELRDKARELADLDEIRWHFIGNLQRNKIKYVAPAATVMECVDTLKLATDFSDAALKLGRRVKVLLQVNVGEEEQKSGCEPSEASTIAEGIGELEGVELVGLMTIPPWGLEAEETRVHFKALSQLRDQMGGKEKLPHLSMGMSHDFEVAIEEGATFVRVGTAIFGMR